MHPKHEKDRYGWAVHTAQLLRDKKMDELDFDSILEEMEALGRSEEHELINRLALIIAHLLKWQFQPDRRGHSWVYTIKEQRKQATIHLEDNPSLKNKLDKILSRAYDIAISKAARETELEDKIFPPESPYTFDQIMDENFLPE